MQPYECSSLRLSVTDLVLALKAGASPNECDGCGVSLLHRHASNVVAVAALLEAGADPYARTLFQAQQPIHYCLDPHAMVLLLDAGVSVDSRDGEGRTALHFAAMHAQPSLVELLLSCGADPDVQDHHGLTPLHFASSRSVVDRLLDANADPSIRDRWGMASWQCYKRDGGLSGRVNFEMNAYIAWSMTKRAAEEERLLLEATTPLVSHVSRPLARL